MNNEPVAHFYPEGEGCTVYDINFAWKVTGTTKPIPLYTHPAKTLTDEEVEIIAEALLMIGFKDDFINYDLKEKAQAILRKAQEK